MACTTFKNLCLLCNSAIHISDYFFDIILRFGR